MLACERITKRSHAQGDVDPTLAAGRAVIELAESAPPFRLEGITRLDSVRGEQVQHPQLALAKPFVAVHPKVQAGCAECDGGGLHSSGIRRGDNDLRGSGAC